MKLKHTTATRTSAKVVSRPISQPAITKLMDSASRGELVAIIATGVSMALTNNKVPALSWTGLIRNGFAHSVKKGKITAAQAKAWEPQLESNDIDDLICAAEFMSRKLEAAQGDLYARWLENLFKPLKPANECFRGHNTYLS